MSDALPSFSLPFDVEAATDPSSKRPTVPSEDDESMEGETEEQRTQRYAGCGMSEASDPDCWQEIFYGRRPPTPAEDTGLMEF